MASFYLHMLISFLGVAMLTSSSEICLVFCWKPMAVDHIVIWEGFILTVCVFLPLDKVLSPKKINSSLQLCSH